MFLKILSQERYNRIYNVLHDIPFDYAIIKGEALSLQAYGATGKRISSDIDILIPVTRLTEFNNILVSHGFQGRELSRADKILLVSSSHQTLPYTLSMPKPWPELLLDVNHDIFWGEYKGKRIDIADFLADVIEINIYGVTVKTLPPLKAFIQLVLHHYKDMNSIYLLAINNRIKMEMFADVYHLLKNNLEDIPLEQLFLISKDLEIVDYVYYILFYTGQVFRDKDVQRYIDAFKTKEGTELLNCYGLNKKERKQWNCDFETRLCSKNLLGIIENDLTEKDWEKIAINQRLFGGEYK